MAQYATLKAAIDAVIKANGQKEITGTVLNEVLTSMVNSLGANYQLAGVATPSTNPGTPDQNVFYLAFEAGTYTNFNATVLSDGISILMWNGSWSSQTFYTIDATPTASSNNLVSSGAVFDAIKTDGSAYDVSAHFPTGGPNSDGKFTLEYILSNANTLIPAAWRKGGMSICFVSSSDNKYVQYRLMTTSFSIIVTDWQGIDDEPIIGSNNLIESGGVANFLYEEEKVAQINIQQTIKGYYGPLQNPSIGQNVNFTSNDGYNLSVYPVESGKTYKISGNKRGPSDSAYGSILFGTVLSGTAKVLALTNPSNIGESVELTYTPSENGYIFTWEYTSSVSNFVVYEVETNSVLDKLQSEVSDALKYKGVTLLDDATINEQKVIENLKFIRIYGNLTDLRLTTVYNDSTYPRRLILRRDSGNPFILEFPQNSNYKRLVTGDYIIEAYYNWDNHTSNVNTTYECSKLQVVPFAFSTCIPYIKGVLDTKNQEQDNEIANINTKNQKQDNEIANINTKNQKQDNEIEDINNLLYRDVIVAQISRQETVNGYYNPGEIGSTVAFVSGGPYVISAYPVQSGKKYKITGNTAGPATISYGSVLFGTTLSASATVLLCTDPSNIGEDVTLNYEPEENGYIFAWDYTTGIQNFSVYEVETLSQFTILKNEIDDELKYDLPYKGVVLLDGATDAEKKAIENLKFLRIYGNVDVSNLKIRAIYNDAEYPWRIIVSTPSINYTLLFNNGTKYAKLKRTDGVVIEAYYDWSNHTSNINTLYERSHIQVSAYSLVPYIKDLEEQLSNPIKDKTIAIMGDSIMMLMRTNSVNNTVSYKGTDGNTYERSQLTLINGLLYLTSSLDNGQVVPTSIRCEVVNSAQSGFDSQNWPSLKTALGVQNLYNLGLGGAMFLDRGVCTAYPYNDGNGETADLPNEVRWLLRKIDEGGWTAPDAVVIWLGTNGAGEPATDNYDAIMALDFEYLNSLDGYQYRHTFYGGLRWSLEMLYRNLPYCTILFASPVQTNPKDYRTYSALSRTSAAIKKMGNRYACQFIDALNEIGVVDFYERPSATPYRGSDGDYYALSSLTEISGVYYVTSTLVDGQPVASSVTAVLIPARFLADGLHPNAAGKKVWTNYLVSQLKAKFYSKQ